MNCEIVKEHLSEFVDGELDEPQMASVRGHLVECQACSDLCADLVCMLDSCKFEEMAEAVPPNSGALWCRISNTIESEITPAKPVETPKPRGLFGRVWNLSFGQAASAIAAIALISSLLTVVGIRNYFEPASDDYSMGYGETQTPFEKILAKVGLADTPQAARQRRLKQQEAAIAYWNKRVQARRVMWDENLRSGFDRNLQAIDQAVGEYQQTLRQNPDDELSSEMLDSVLTEKMNLLREFSEL